MKKLLLAMIFAAVLSTSPAFALFTNGGFETGDLSGWTLDYGYRDGSYDTKDITWGQSSTYFPEAKAVTSTAGAYTSLDTDIDAYNGNYMALINDLDGNYHSTKLSQTDSISAQDILDGAKLYVNWGALLVEPDNDHPEGAQPFFAITVKIGSLTESIEFDALDHEGDVVGYYGGDIWYQFATWTYDLDGYAEGTNVTIEMIVSDCGWGGHGGYAILDGIGTIKQEIDAVPEPATMVLFGLGILGLAGVSRKK